MLKVQDQAEAAVLTTLSTEPDAGSETEEAVPAAASLWKVSAGAVTRGVQPETAPCFIETAIFEPAIPSPPEDQAVYTGDASPLNTTTEPARRLPFTV